MWYDRMPISHDEKVIVKNTVRDIRGLEIYTTALVVA